MASKMTEQIGYLYSCPRPFLYIGGVINPQQLEEGGPANQPVLVGVRVHEELQQEVVQLGVRVALLVGHSLLHFT